MTEKPPGPTEHARWCPEPNYEWQQPIWPTSSTRGRCIHCGAVKIETAGQQAPERRRTRRSSA